MKRLFLRTTLLLGGLLTGAVAQAELALIVHPDSAVADADKDTVVRLYSGKTNKLSKDFGLEPYDQAAGSAARKEFYEAVIGTTEAKMRSYWSRLMFSGKGQPPEQLDDDAAVVAKIATDTKAIGYVNPASVDSSVRILLVLP